jgi:RNA polymerase sigma-70 factor (ECF subfamily)
MADQAAAKTAGAFFICVFIVSPEPFCPLPASFSLMIHAMTSQWEIGIERHQTRDEREEALWVTRARTGDEAAFRWLLGRYRMRVVRLAAHVLRSGGDAEDVAQEAFLRAFRRLPDYRGTGRFSAWLFQITVRLCLDRRRSVRWQREVPEDAAPPAPAPNTHLPDNRLLIETLLDRLSPPMRAALVLREIEGLEYDEIAETLQIPVGTVRSRLHSARAQFRDLWAAIDEENSHV